MYCLLVYIVLNKRAKKSRSTLENKVLSIIVYIVLNKLAIPSRFTVKKTVLFTSLHVPKQICFSK